MLEVGPSSGETLMRRRHSSGVGYANGCLLEIGARAASVGSWPETCRLRAGDRAGGRF